MSTRDSQKSILGKPRRAKGFSAIELVVAMAVVLIISGIALPSISTNMRVYQLNSVASMVADQLKSSRFDAIRRNVPQTCYISPVSGGYRLWTDTAGTGTYVSTDHTTNITGAQGLIGNSGVPTWSGLASAMGVSGTTTLSGGGQTTVTFDPRGAVVGGNAINVLFIGYAGNPALGYRAVVIMPSGSVQVWTPRGNSWNQVN